MAAFDGYQIKYPILFPFCPRVRKSRRKVARLRFDKKKYRRRKLGERPFGNIEVRRSKCYYKKPENKSLHNRFSIFKDQNAATKGNFKGVVVLGISF
jgi:hypothetical protein